MLRTFGRTFFVSARFEFKQRRIFETRVFGSEHCLASIAEWGHSALPGGFAPPEPPLESVVERKSVMRKRINEIKVRLTDEELSALTERAKMCGYSREAYVRTLLSGYIPQPMPPPDYHAMMKELHHIGNNLNQIAQKTHALNIVDAKRYDDATRQFAAAAARIEEAVILPRRKE
jgi:hypothetical protein